MAANIASLKSFPTKSSTAQKRWFIHHSHFDLQYVHPATKKTFLREIRDVMLSLIKLEKAVLDKFWREALHEQTLLGREPGEMDMTVMRVQRRILEELDCKHEELYRWKEFRAWLHGANRALYNYYHHRMSRSRQRPRTLSIEEPKRIDSSSPVSPRTSDVCLVSSTTVSPLNLEPAPQTQEADFSGDESATTQDIEDDLDDMLSELLVPINHVWSNPVFNHPQVSSSRHETQFPDSPTYPLFGLVSKEEEEAALHDHVAFECGDGEGRIWKEPRRRFEFAFW